VVAADSAAAADRVHRAECGACHPDTTAAEMREMLPSAEEMREDPEMIHDLNHGMISGTVSLLQEMGAAYEAAPRGQMIDTSELHSPYMPPFVGTDQELEALVEYLASLARSDDRRPRVARAGGAS
jgi:mono/diheme cytochrome c family protein